MKPIMKDFTYQTDTIAKKSAIGEHVQDINRRLEGFHDLPIVSSEFAKNLCLFLENGDDRIDRVTFFKLFGEGMFYQLSLRLVFIVLKSCVEEVLEGRGGSTHIVYGRNMERGVVCGEKATSE